VQGALQNNTTAERNALELGFLAGSRAEELPAGPAERIYVTRASRDVTAEMTDGLAEIADPAARARALEAREKELVAACERDRPGLRCQVAAFFRGAEYQLIERLELRDVRLVYAPPRSVGNYGGEIDNWAWPRHTGDYSFLRAYVGPDGAPADPSPANVPYRPASWLRVASEPLREHDFVLTAGYPGATSRVTTYSEVKYDVESTYPRSIEVMQAAYDMLTGLEQRGGMTAIKAGMYKQFVQNALENAQGTLAGLTRGDALARAEALDRRVREWAAEPGRERYAAGLVELERVLADARATSWADELLVQAGAGRSLLGGAGRLVRTAEERARPDAEREPGFQDRDLPQAIARQRQQSHLFDPEIDRGMARLALVRAAALPEAERPWLAALLGAKRGQAIDAALIDRRLEEWYRGTRLTDEALRIDLLTRATSAQLARSRDPLIRAARALRPYLAALEERQDRRAGELLLLAPLHAVAMREALGGALAPDANSTLRVGYGTVKRRGEGRPFTLASEIPAKDRGQPPYDAPAPLLQAIAAGQWGPYADADLGGLPVDFLSDLDTTGGSSGSPTLNHRGELIGLVFDGTIESVSSDVVFDPEVTRSIHLDLRYALWIMDRVDGADWLLVEMGVEPRLP
jgi:hypothetical protein